MPLNIDINEMNFDKWTTFETSFLNAIQIMQLISLDDAPYFINVEKKIKI